MTAPERFAIVRFLLHRGHRPYMTHHVGSLRDFGAPQHVKRAAMDK